MMPFYYVCKTHSVPGYLSSAMARRSSTVAAVSFAFMTVLMSGVNMFAMAEVMKIVLGWDLNFSIIVSSLAVAVVCRAGGLRSAIFNEVLQFVLIWAGAPLVPILGLIETGGWTGLKARLAHNIAITSPPPETTPICGAAWGTLPITPWAFTGQAFCLASGSRSASATGPPIFSLFSACLPPTLAFRAEWRQSSGSFFKMAVPLIVILPGLLGLAVLQNADGSLMHLVRERSGCAPGEDCTAITKCCR